MSDAPSQHSLSTGRTSMVSGSVCVARTDSYLTYFNGSTLEAKDVQLESAKSDPRKATLVAFLGSDLG
jgi:hypothetical protein